MFDSQGILESLGSGKICFCSYRFDSVARQTIFAKLCVSCIEQVVVYFVFLFANAMRLKFNAIHLGVYNNRLSFCYKN